METIDIEATRLFVKVVQHGSYTRAAHVLNIPKSTISKAVTKLEKETGTKLLLRSTRSQTLTPAGRAFYETCLGPLQTLEDAQKSLYGQSSVLTGKIRITAPEDLGAYVIAPTIGRLCQKHPGLGFELHYTNQIVDLIKDGFDLAIRIGTLKESNLKAKRIGQLSMVVVATPGYVKGHSKIQHPKDLEKHECLALTSSALNQTWRLRSSRESSTVNIHSRIECNQMTSLYQMALAGAGALLAPYYLCKADLDQGRLVRVLPQWSGNDLPVSILSPLSMSTGRMRVVSEEIFEAVKVAL